MVSLPEHGHGSYRVHATEEIHRAHVNGINLITLASVIYYKVE